MARKVGTVKNLTYFHGVCIDKTALNQMYINVLPAYNNLIRNTIVNKLPLVVAYYSTGAFKIDPIDLLLLN